MSFDATALAAGLLEAVPANRLFGIRVRRAGAHAGEVQLDVADGMQNVIGALGAGGLLALADAAALAAIVGSASSPGQFDGVTPLASRAELDFLAPGRGTLTGACGLDPAACEAIDALLAGAADHARLSTAIVIRDGAGERVATAQMRWSLRRGPVR